MDLDAALLEQLEGLAGRRLAAGRDGELVHRSVSPACGGGCKKARPRRVDGARACGPLAGAPGRGRGNRFGCAATMLRRWFCRQVFHCCRRTNRSGVRSKVKRLHAFPTSRHAAPQATCCVNPKLSAVGLPGQTSSRLAFSAWDSPAIRIGSPVPRDRRSCPRSLPAPRTTAPQWARHTRPL